MVGPIRYALVVAGVVFLATLVYVSLTPPTLRHGSLETVQMAGNTVRIILADSPEEREMGLSGRTALAEDQGMLFVFPEDGTYSFWMKDMLFSIDILWLSSNGTIVDIERNVSPDTFPTAFSPEAPALYVLELPAGYSELHNVQKGDVVKI